MLFRSGFVLKSWDELLAQGSIVSRRVTNREAAAALEQAGGPGTRPDVAFGAKPDDAYVEVFTGLATPQSVGRNMIGAAVFNMFQRPIQAGSHVIAIGSTGPYDFMGPGYHREGQTFDRVRLVQGESVIDFKRERFIWLAVRDVPAGQPAQHYAAFFTLPPSARFEPLSPWRLEVLINGTDPQGKQVSAATTQTVTKLTAAPTVTIASLVYTDNIAPLADQASSTLAVGPASGFLSFIQTAGTHAGSVYRSAALSAGRLSALSLASETASPTYAVTAVDVACNQGPTATWTPTAMR